MPVLLHTSSVQALPSSPHAPFGTHTPVQAPPEQTNGHEVPSLCHWPVAEQLWMPPCGPHLADPGTHSPPQVPVALRQTYGHWALLAHSLATQFWGTLPLHCLVPLVQAPPQLAVPPEKLQLKSQVSRVAHLPVLSQS